MIKKRYYRLLVAGFIFLTLSCASSSAMKKEKAEAGRNIGEAYLRQRQYTAALKEFLKAEALMPDDYYLQNDLGICYMGKNRLDMAIKHLEKAIKLKHDYIPARNNLGTVYLAKKDWDGAIAIFKDISQDLLYATPHYPLTNLGFAYYNKSQYQLAMRYYLKALELKPGFMLARRGLGKTYIALNEPFKAIGELKAVQKKNPKFGELYLDLAEAYEMAGEIDKALDACDQAVALSRPNSPLAFKAKEKARHIRAIY